MKEFFGFGGYQRAAEGFLSWQHLAFVTSLMVIMVGLAVFLGKRNHDRSDKVKNRVLIAAALLIAILLLRGRVIGTVKGAEMEQIVIDGVTYVQILSLTSATTIKAATWAAPSPATSPSASTP